MADGPSLVEGGPARSGIEEIRAELLRQRNNYRRELPRKLAHLEALCTEACGNPATASGVLGELRRAAHTMHGTGGTFGFRELGIACASLEEAAGKRLERPDDAGGLGLEHAMQEVRRCVEQSVGTTSESQ
ncbi:MAG: hypothetical protein JWP41_2967 [Ramlibacter sp.]|jgi:chemotaxis protein histidine kinase CheA|nr:hypothetical protein [Ramlibacter sp.]